MTECESAGNRHSAQLRLTLCWRRGRGGWARIEWGRVGMCQSESCYGSRLHARESVCVCVRQDWCASLVNKFDIILQGFFLFQVEIKLMRVH